MKLTRIAAFAGLVWVLGCSAKTTPSGEGTGPGLGDSQPGEDQ